MDDRQSWCAIDSVPQSVHSKQSVSIDIHNKLSIKKHLQCLTEGRNVQGWSNTAVRTCSERCKGGLTFCDYAFACSNIKKKTYSRNKYVLYTEYGKVMKRVQNTRYCYWNRELDQRLFVSRIVHFCVYCIVVCNLPVSCEPPAEFLRICTSGRSAGYCANSSRTLI